MWLICEPQTQIMLETPPPSESPNRNRVAFLQPHNARAYLLISLANVGMYTTRLCIDLFSSLNGYVCYTTEGIKASSLQYLFPTPSIH
jgi:hypothetical protein